MESNHKYKIAIAANANMVGGVEEALVQLLQNLNYDTCSVTLFGEIIDYYRERIPSEVEIVSTQSSVTAMVRQLFASKRYLRCFWYLAHSVGCKLLYHLNKKDLQAYLSMRSYRYLPKLTEQNYDLVIAYTYLVASIVGNAGYRINASQRVLWVHGESNPIQVAKSLDKNIYDRFNTVFCCSEAIANKYKQLYPRSGKKAKVFYNIADVERIKASACEPIDLVMQTPSIVTVGRLSEEKGQQMIPKTVRLLLDAGYTIHWYLVGDGPLRKRIEQEIQVNAVSDHVTLLGSQTNPYPYIKHSDLYVQPSFTEGYCTTTVEAKILCKPIITTDAPGMREQIIPHQTGLITDAFTSESLFENIAYLLDSPETAQALSANLQRESQSKVCELEKLYDLLENFR
jgi:glycosyltransferase involved in cell wall biosynthesis